MIDLRLHKNPNLILTIDKISRQPFSPEILNASQNPILYRDGRALKLQDAVKLFNFKMVGFGDSHGLIFPMIHFAVKRKILSLPLQRAIVNFDNHTDTNPNIGDRYSGSWQRVGVNQQLWKPKNSYNVKPSTSTTGQNSGEGYVQETKLEQVTNLFPAILSIDLDYFGDLDPNGTEFSNSIATILQLTKHAKVIGIFSSGEWNLSPDRLWPKLSSNTIIQICNKISLAAFTSQNAVKYKI